jgi:hypothetical protein
MPLACPAGAIRGQASQAAAVRSARAAGKARL